MRAPRMRVAVVGDSTYGRVLANGMAEAGHSVSGLTDFDQALEYDALILAVADNLLARVVEQLRGRIRSGQIVIHTCLAQGVQALDDVETQGAVVAAMAPVTAERWALTAFDELGQTVAGLILGELGLTAVDKTDSERGPLAAYAAYTAMTSLIADYATYQLDHFIDVPETIIPPAPSDIDAAEVIFAYQFITEPGLRRAYVDAARRCGELADIDQLEIWALQEETR